MKKKIFLCLMMASLFARPSLGQQADGNSSESLRSFKRGTAIVLFSAVGGAILGVSTLSFYGEPQKHTDNITTGALLGVLAGGGYVIWENTRHPESPRWSLTLREGSPAVAYQLNF